MDNALSNPNLPLYKGKIFGGIKTIVIHGTTRVWVKNLVIC